MKLKLSSLIALLFVFTNTLFAQPPSASISPSCPILQNVVLQVDSTSNTFSLDYTQSSGQYMVWDLHQETAAGDIIVNYGASDTNIAAEALNSTPSNGTYYINVWNVCDGDGTYDGAKVISMQITKFVEATIIDDALICYIKLPEDNPCSYIPEGRELEICPDYANINLDFVRLVVFGCQDNVQGGVNANMGIAFESKNLNFSSLFSKVENEPKIKFNDSMADKFNFNDFVVRGRDLACASLAKTQKTNNQYTLYPNPTSGDLTINLNLPASTPIDVQVLNIQSQLVKVLSNKEEAYKGKYQSTFDVSDLQPGLYFLEIKTNEGKSTMKFMKN